MYRDAHCGSLLALGVAWHCRTCLPADASAARDPMLWTFLGPIARASEANPHHEHIKSPLALV